MTTRVLSAVAAALLLVGVGIWTGPAGLFTSCALALVVGTFEFARMIIPRYSLPRATVPLYWFTSLAVFAGPWCLNLDVGLCFALANVAYAVGTLWLARGRVINDDLLPALALGTFGLLYCALFPLYAARVVTGPGGITWFAYLLSVVFAGDTFAYFGGKARGRRKLMADVSPNKTWEGSLTGLAGSGLVGTALLWYARPDLPATLNLGVSVACGFAAQTGDLLISLVKRVARVKDTGRLMPGHGGMLDRLDGVLIACPMVYAFSTWVG